MIQTNQISVEDVAQRRGELRKMRELMFRAEVKAKRVGKIKSKTYRRIKRKEKERTEEKIDEDDNEDEKLHGRVKGTGSDDNKDGEDDQDGDGWPVRAVEDDSDSNSEVGAQELELTLKGKRKASSIKAFEQRDLVAAAFAGDNVVQVCSFFSSHLLTAIDRFYSLQNFEEAKRREIASDAPREVDTTIPGWVKTWMTCLSLVWN